MCVHELIKSACLRLICMFFILSPLAAQAEVFISMCENGCSSTQARHKVAKMFPISKCPVNTDEEENTCRDDVVEHVVVFWGNGSYHKFQVQHGPYYLDIKKVELDDDEIEVLKELEEVRGQIGIELRKISNSTKETSYSPARIN